IPAICLQATSGYCVRNSSDSRFTASPSRSNWCKIADWVLKSSRNADLSRVPLNSTASLAAFRISRSAASSRGIVRLSAFQDGFSSDPIGAAFNCSTAYQINLTTENGRKIVLHGDVIEQTPFGIVGECDEDVYVTVWPKVVPKHGAEQRKLGNFPPTAELSDPVAVDRDLGAHRQGPLPLSRVIASRRVLQAPLRRACR